MSHDTPTHPGWQSMGVYGEVGAGGGRSDAKFSDGYSRLF